MTSELGALAAVTVAERCAESSLTSIMEGGDSIYPPLMCLNCAVLLKGLTLAVSARSPPSSLSCSIKGRVSVEGCWISARLVKVVVEGAGTGLAERLVKIPFMLTIWREVGPPSMLRV